MRTYIMSVDEQRNFDPDAFTFNLKLAGFEFDNDTCPIKLRDPWLRVTLESGAVLWRQWPEEQDPVDDDDGAIRAP